MLATFRSEDVVARIGGDEFAVILPATDAATAEAVLQRVLAKRPSHVYSYITSATKQLNVMPDSDRVRGRL